MSIFLSADIVPCHWTGWEEGKQLARHGPCAQRCTVFQMKPSHIGWSLDTSVITKCVFLGLWLSMRNMQSLEGNRGRPCFPGGSDRKESTCNEGNLGLVPGLGKSPEEGNRYPLQYSGLENSMDKGASRATVPGFMKSWTRLRDFHFHFLKMLNRALLRYFSSGQKTRTPAVTAAVTVTVTQYQALRYQLLPI